MICLASVFGMGPQRYVVPKGAHRTLCRSATTSLTVICRILPKAILTILWSRGINVVIQGCLEWGDRRLLGWSGWWWIWGRLRWIWRRRFTAIAMVRLGLGSRELRIEVVICSHGGWACRRVTMWVEHRYAQVDRQVIETDGSKSLKSSKRGSTCRKESTSNDSWICVRSQEWGCCKFKERYVLCWAVRWREGVAGLSRCTAVSRVQKVAFFGVSDAR